VLLPICEGRAPCGLRLGGRKFGQGDVTCTPLSCWRDSRATWYPRSLSHCCTSWFTLSSSIFSAIVKEREPQPPCPDELTSGRGHSDLVLGAVYQLLAEMAPGSSKNLKILTLEIPPLIQVYFWGRTRPPRVDAAAMGKYTTAKSFDDNSSDLAQAPTDEQKDAASKVDVLQVQVLPAFLARMRLPPAHPGLVSYGTKPSRTWREATMPLSSRLWCRRSPLHPRSATSDGWSILGHLSCLGSGVVRRTRWGPPPVLAPGSSTCTARIEGKRRPALCSCMLSDSSQFRA
jgi:hypothetical protein